jgi:predicted transcriptional regulator
MRSKSNFGDAKPVMTYVIKSMTYVIFIYFSTHPKSNGEYLLILPCEVAVKSVVPAVKALMAQQLVEEHGMKQEQVAEILGISQSAVSKYFRKVRGHVIEVNKVQEARPLVASMVIMLMNGEHRRAEFLQLFCETCGAIRKTGVVCGFCKKSDPKIKKEECGFCMELRYSRNGR